MMLFYFIVALWLGAVSLICGLHYLQEIGQPEKARKRRDSPPKPEPRDQRRDFKVIVVGGSTAGLTMAAKLEQAKVDYLVLEEHSSCGEQWRRRYDRLHLRTIKEVSSLPGLPLPAFYPVFPSKDQMADYYDASSKFLNVKTDTSVVSANFDPETELWTIRTKTTESKRSPSSFGFPSSSAESSEGGFGTPTDVYVSKSLVVCTGCCGTPMMPDIPGRDKYTGQVLHSSEYKTGRDFAQKKVLVVGPETSGAEIAADLWECDAKVGLLSSSPVVIISRSLLRPFLLFYPLSRLIPRQVRRTAYNLFAPLLLGSSLGDSHLQLAHLGKLKKNEPLPPLWIDVGTVDLIRQHEITVFTKDISTFTPNGVVFKDGKEEVFDAVIMNTGFQKTSYKTFLEPETVKQGKEPVTGRRASRHMPEEPREGVEIERKKLYFLGFNDDLVQLKEDHYVCEEILRDMKLKRYVC